LREEGIRHISLTEESALFLIAPCSADVVAKLALGIADDFLSTFASRTAPPRCCPCDETNMLAHPAVEANLEILRSRGIAIVEPGEGWLACGWMGKGRLAEPEEIVRRVEARSPLRGTSRAPLLVSATDGRAADPVRVLTNRSSGKMLRIAERARERGARVLPSGPRRSRSLTGSRRCASRRRRR
jgi:phosphopantothenoylcysteine decarboxylase/phosphopantothenate--cysteine ligase